MWEWNVSTLIGCIISSCSVIAVVLKGVWDFLDEESTPKGGSIVICVVCSALCWVLFATNTVDIEEDANSEDIQTGEFMNIDDYQKELRMVAVYDLHETMGELVISLAEEVGEIARLVNDKRLKRKAPSIDDLILEIGDVVAIAALMAGAIDVPLSLIMKLNIKKLKSRKERKVIKGSGDDR